MAAEPLEDVSPLALVFAVALFVAQPSQSPVVIIAEPAPSWVVVVTLSIAIATAGAIETPPPDAPVFASVVVVLVELAGAEKAPTLDRSTAAPTSARVLTFTMESATDAPM